MSLSTSILIVRYWQPMVFFILLAAAAATTWYYQERYDAEFRKSAEILRHLRNSEENLNQLVSRHAALTSMDKKYVEELNEKKEYINRLERDVADGNRRLRLNTTCRTENYSASTGVDNGNASRLTDTAERAYFTLRERIETNHAMIQALQQYISEQCRI